MTPYYDDGTCTIYHGDCREIDAWDIAGGVMVTDPPYGIRFESGWTGSSIAGDETTGTRDAALRRWNGRPALVFGSPSLPEPPGVKARLVWHRPGSGMGDLKMPWKPDWEVIYVLGAGFTARHRGSGVLTYHWDDFRGDALHPHQKPINLMRHLVDRCPPLAEIVDPFMGSGTTLRAAKDCGRRAIGIEVEERYCEIAARRLAQEVLDFGGVA
jgi:site-specific DNA-methyltransferase (adenine-specific)